MSKNIYDKYFKIVKKAIDEVDPMHIACVAENEYEPEIKELTERLFGKNLSEEEIFKQTKDVFDLYFYEEERNIQKYEKIANKIYNKITKESK